MGNSDHTNTDSSLALADAQASGGSINIQDAEHAYYHYLPQAKALPEEQILAFPGSPHLVLHNVQLGVKALFGFEPKIRRELPEVNLDALLMLPFLAQANVFAASQVNRQLRPEVTAKPLLKEAHPIRTLMLNTADVFAHRGVIPRADVEKIRQGRGPLDTAQDLIDLAALFRKYSDRFAGQSPVLPDKIARASELGTQLLQVLQAPTVLRTSKLAPEVHEAIENRDRIWTLLSYTHLELRRVGMWLWMEDVSDHVPPLQSRTNSHKPRKAKKPAPKKEDDEAGEGEDAEEETAAAQAGSNGTKPASAKPQAAAGSAKPQASGKGNGGGNKPQGNSTSASAKPASGKNTAAPPAPAPSTPAAPADADDDIDIDDIDMQGSV